MHVKIMYGWTKRGRTNGHTFAPVDLTAPKVAAGKKMKGPQSHTNLEFLQYLAATRRQV